MHHSDGRFLSGWNRGLSSTGFLCGGEEKQGGFVSPVERHAKIVNVHMCIWIVQCEDEPAIQSTAMPSTRLMPVVMMSSLHVWSRLALEIRFSPMSVQYTVSLPVGGGGEDTWYISITAQAKNRSSKPVECDLDPHWCVCTVHDDAGCFHSPALNCISVLGRQVRQPRGHVTHVYLQPFVQPGFAPGYQEALLCQCCGIYCFSPVRSEKQCYEYFIWSFKVTGQTECDAVWVREHRRAAAVEFYLLYTSRTLCSGMMVHIRAAL